MVPSAPFAVRHALAASPGALRVALAVGLSRGASVGKLARRSAAAIVRTPEAIRTGAVTLRLGRCPSTALQPALVVVEEVAFVLVGASRVVVELRAVCETLEHVGRVVTLRVGIAGSCCAIATSVALHQALRSSRVDEPLAHGLVLAR